MTDDEVEAALIEVPGIGPRTAHGFLLVALDRPDVLLTGDIALRRAIERLRIPSRSERGEDGPGGGTLATVSEPGSALSVRVRIQGGNLMSSADGNRIGIIGAGRLGQAMARVAIRAGRSVVIANSRGPESLTSVVSALGEGVSAGTQADAARAAIAVIAVPWDHVPEAVERLPWDSQVVIDATNDWGADDLDGRTSSEIVADLVAGARVVKAANTLSAEVLASDPDQADGQRVIFISGDKDDAKATVLALFQDAGFAVIDLGDLATGGAKHQIHHPLAGVNLICLG